MSKTIRFEGDQITLFGTASLGALIRALEPLKDCEYDESDAIAKGRSVFFDFCGTYPDYLGSYRGYYDHLAMTFKDEGACPGVAGVVALLKAADGKEFCGYKGGHFRMNVSTPVWVANTGKCDSTAIVGLLVESTRVTILTEYIP